MTGRPIKNLTGKRFGRLVAIERAGWKSNRVTWRCQCDCGKQIVVICSSLLRGNTKSCGCVRLEKLKAASLALVNRRFGRLRVIEHAGNRGREKAWRCECVCGASAIVTTGHLRSGHTKSCGCLQPDAVRGFNFGRGMR